jgi:hypothetical protein
MDLFGNLVRMIQAYGILDFYLPFLLTFAVFYGLLTKVKIFSIKENEKVEPNRPINAIIAVVAAFYVIAYTPVGLKFSEFMSTFFTQTIMAALVSLVGIGLIVGIGSAVGWKPECWYGKFTISAILVAAIILIFFASGGPEFFGIARNMVGFGLTIEDVFFATLIVLTLIIILTVTGWSPKPCKKEGG